MNPVTKYWTLTVAVSVISYLFTWKQDQSALTAADPAIQNAAASSGLSLGHFLVTESFGLAAFCILAFLMAWCVKLLWKELWWACWFPNWEKSLLVSSCLASSLSGSIA